MFSKFLSFFNAGMRAFKIQDAKRQKRFGIAARNLDELISKGCEKLQLKTGNVTVVLEDDGTIVDSEAFFKKLPIQTVLVFLTENETWSGAGALIYDALSKLYNSSKRAGIAEQIKDLLQEENAPEKIHIMSQYLDLLRTDVEAEERYEDEEWFEGLNQKYKRKSEVLRHTAQTRIRSYYTSAKDQIEKECKGEEKELLIEVLDNINQHLKSNDFHGHYFDRTSTAKKRMCDKTGWFMCEGAFDEDKCVLYHTINPYASRGHRQLFGLWNLDHIIEKSREVIPSLIEAVKIKSKHRDVGWKQVYRLLFTRENLKLVQIACHKKAARSTNKCKPQDFLINL